MIIVIIAVVVGLLVIGGGIYWFISSQSSNQTTSVNSQTSNQNSSFKKYNADQVVAAIQKAGLPISDVQVQQIGGTQAPATEVESKQFVIASVAPNGGQILIFDSQSGLDAKKAWYAKYPDLAPYVYVKGNAMLQLNSGLPKVEAEKYLNALNQI